MTADSGNTEISVLLIQEGSSDASAIRDGLAKCQGGPFRLQCVASLSMAFARIAGGGVDLILLGAPAGEANDRGMASLLQLLSGAPQVPTVLMCGPGEEGLAVASVKAGAMDYVMVEHLAADLSRVVGWAIEMARCARPTPVLKMPERRKSGGVISFIGAKGGVGNTTVALNIAATLARRATVVLVEMRPTFGTLSSYLRPLGLTLNLSDLLDSESCSVDSAEVRACLWNCKRIPGLSVLFGPQTASECAELEPEQAALILKVLSQSADYVIVDLPPSLSDANRAVIEHSRSLVLTVERDPVCLQSARWMVQEIESWGSAPQPIGAVLVNRALVNCPTPLAEINTQLACELLEVIPPAADLCLSAQNARMPLVLLHPESFAVTALNALSEILAPDNRNVPFASLEQRAAR